MRFIGVRTEPSVRVSLSLSLLSRLGARARDRTGRPGARSSSHEFYECYYSQKKTQRFALLRLKLYSLPPNPFPLFTRIVQYAAGVELAR